MAAAVVAVVVAEEGRGDGGGPGPGREPEDSIEDEGANEGNADVELGGEELGSQHATDDEESEDGLFRDQSLGGLGRKSTGIALTSKMMNPAGPE